MTLESPEISGNRKTLLYRPLPKTTNIEGDITEYSRRLFMDWETSLEAPIYTAARITCA
jgi:hypothetical protein